MKYWQKIRIKDWFYEGIEWRVIHARKYIQTDIDSNKITFINEYWIRIDDELIEYFHEENLILI